MIYRNLVVPLFRDQRPYKIDLPDLVTILDEEKFDEVLDNNSEVKKNTTHVGTTNSTLLGKNIGKTS